MRKNIAAHIVHHVLAHHASDHGLRVLRDILNCDADEEGDDHPLEPLPIAVDDMFVDGDLGQPRAGLARYGGEHDGEKGEDDAATMGLEIAQQLHR